MILIEKILVSEIQDSRGNPTLKVEVSAGGAQAAFSVPSGASTGIHEAHELRDADGHMLRAIQAVHDTITPSLLGVDICDQRGIDKIMLDLDGTATKTKLGANAMLGVSIAIAKTAAASKHIDVYEYLRELSIIKDSRTTPLLFINVINGGKHAHNGLAFQEYHVVPDVEGVTEAVEIGVLIQKELVSILSKRNHEPIVYGDEGGIAPKLDTVREPLVLLTEVIQTLGLTHKVKIALDVAASSFYKDGVYTVDGVELSRLELLQLYDEILREFDIFSIEDPFMEEDFQGFQALRERFPGVRVVGDDLTVTNPKRLQKAIEEGSIDTILIKPNQIGTLSEMLDTMELAVKNNIKLIISHRSGETMDDFIADVAYAYGAFGLKAGSPIAKERRVKYDRLITISEK